MIERDIHAEGPENAIEKQGGFTTSRISSREFLEVFRPAIESGRGGQSLPPKA
jgi:hypothetical protein